MHDVVIIHFEEGRENDWHWIKGGGRIGEPRPAETLPIFLAYFPESVYGEGSGHYQSICPVRPNMILDAILEGGGCDVASHLGFSSLGEFYSVYFPTHF